MLWCPNYLKSSEISLEEMIQICERKVDEPMNSCYSIVQSRMETDDLYAPIYTKPVDKMAELFLFISLQEDARRFNQTFSQNLRWTRDRVQFVHQQLLRYNILQEMERIEILWGPHNALTLDNRMMFESNISREFVSLFDESLS